MARAQAAQLASSSGMNRTVDTTVNDKEFARAIREVIKDIIDGTMKGMKSVQNETYDEALKGLKKFKHTARKESLGGLIKPPLEKTKNGYVAEVNQIELAGIILEKKINVHTKAGVISLSNPDQRNAHIWLLEKGMIGTRVSERSQISKTGHRSNVEPMQDAVDNYLVPDGVDEIVEKIKGNMKPVYNR